MKKVKEASVALLAVLGMLLLATVIMYTLQQAIPNGLKVLAVVTEIAVYVVGMAWGMNWAFESEDKE